MSQSSSQQFLLLFHYLNVAGVCPNSFDNASISGKNKLYIGFLGVFPTLYCIRQLYYLYNNHQDIAAFLLVVGGMVEWINFLLGIITPALNSTMIVKFFQIIEEAQETTISLDISRPTLPSQKTQIWYIVIFGIFPSVAAILAWAPYLSFYTIASIIILITVTFATLVKMKLMLLLLNSKFENLNDKFKEVSDESMGISSKAEFDVDHFLFKLHNIKYVKPTDKSTGITVDQVLKFNKAHFQLCDAHKMLDSLFSLSILAETLFVSFLLVRAFTSVYHISLIGVFQLYGISFYTMFLFISVLSSATDVKNNVSKTLSTKNHDKV